MRSVCIRNSIAPPAIALLVWLLLSFTVAGFCVIPASRGTASLARNQRQAAQQQHRDHRSSAVSLFMSGKADEGSLSSRRSWLSAAATCVTASSLVAQTAFPACASAASDTKLEMFEDPNLNFHIKVPTNWEKQVQALPDRRKIILFVDPASDGDKSLLFFAFTPVRDDFTSLSSFGSVDQVAQMTILPKGSIAGSDNESELIKAESKKNAYYFDYKAETPGQPLTHFRTIFSLAPVVGSAGATLVTLTAQAPESRYSELKPLFDEIMDSYGKLK